VGRWFAPRLSVPITGIVEIAFDAMQIGVDPSAILIVSIHDDAMRFCPNSGSPPTCNAADTPAGGASALSDCLKAAGVTETPATTIFPA